MRKLLRQIKIPKAIVIPDLPFDEYQICNFQPWDAGEVTYLALSLVYGTFFLRLSTAHAPASDSFLVKDALALLIVVYSAKSGGARVYGMPSLLNKILQDATTYFLVLSTGHLLLLFFEVFAPVNDRPVDLCSTAHDQLRRLRLNVFLESKLRSQIL